MLEFLTSAFTKPLSKAVWTELLDKHPAVEGMENVLVAPVMETGMKEDIKKKHGYYKTKESFSFDEGLAERQSPILTAVQPIVAALEARDQSRVSYQEGEMLDSSSAIPCFPWCSDQLVDHDLGSTSDKVTRSL